MHLTNLWLLLGGALLDERFGLANVPHELIGQHINSELHVTEYRSLLLRHCHKLLSEGVGDGAAAVKHRLDNGPQILIRHLSRKYLVKGFIGVLGDCVRVHTRVGRAKALRSVIDRGRLHAHGCTGRRVQAQGGSVCEGGKCDRKHGERNRTVQGWLWSCNPRCEFVRSSRGGSFMPPFGHTVDTTTTAGYVLNLEPKI